MAPRVLATAAAALALSPGIALGYGEPVDGRPSMAEREVHVFTDMVRVDPAAVGFGDDFDPVPPLRWDDSLSAVARIFAEDMRDNGCFNADHSSCDGTSFEERVGAWYSDRPIGENIAQGYGSAEAAVLDGWLHSDGHRANMLSPAFDEIGAGVTTGNGGPWYVQDFGGSADVADVRITSGAHAPLLPAVGIEATFYAAWHDPGGQSPASAEVAMPGECRNLALAAGTEEMGVWSWTVAIEEEACVPYVFRFTLPGGTEERYPSTGALVMATGGARCEEWQDAPPEGAFCLGEDDTGAGGCGATAASPDAQGDGSGCGRESGTPGGNSVDDSTYGSCDQASSPPLARAALAALVALAVARRRAV
ncbi:CAP domain-containing protein [Myxococcota bacterium]|nr:CAP domain-containing protein [Myxococcota bacterium]